MEQKVRDEPRAWNDNRERLPGALEKATAAVKEASLGEKWREARPSKKIVFGLLVAAVALTMIVGFNWGGWVTGGTAQKTADTGARDAVVSRLAPICVAQFNLDPQKTAKLNELKAVSSYQRGDYVQKQVWATMPGDAKPDSRVADACARLLIGS